MTLAELLEALRSAERTQRCIAAKAIVRVDPALLQPVSGDLLELLFQSGDWLVQAQLLTLLPKLGLSEVEAFDAARSRLTQRSSIVRTVAMQCMFDLAEGQPDFRAEILAVIDRALERGTPAMKARARHLKKTAAKRWLRSG